MTLRSKCCISTQKSHRLFKSIKRVLVHCIQIQENSKREIKCQIYIISHVLLFGTYIKAKCSFFLACRIPLLWCFWRCNTSKHPRGRSKGLVIATAQSEIQIISTGENPEISHCPSVRPLRSSCKLLRDYGIFLFAGLPGKFHALFKIHVHIGDPISGWSNGLNCDGSNESENQTLCFETHPRKMTRLGDIEVAAEQGPNWHGWIVLGIPLPCKYTV